MKILNRPMFRMGGPIKEGIMSGIKEPRQRYQDAGQVFKNVQSVLEEGAAADPAVLNEAAKLGIGNPFRVQEFRPYMKKVVTKPTVLDDNSIDSITLNEDFTTTVRNPETGVLEYSAPSGLSLEAQAALNRISATEYAKLKKAEEDAKNLKSKADGTVITGGKSPFAYTLDAPKDINNKNKDVVRPESIVEDKKTRVNKILESLGYDRAQKNALYDAMIKAGQRISRKGLSADNLVSDVIAETSQSYDKPEKLREAANLMDVQQTLDIEKIEKQNELKKNAYEEKEAYLTGILGDADLAKRISVGSPKNIIEAQQVVEKAGISTRTEKGVDATLSIYFDGINVPKYKGELSDTAGNKLLELKGDNTIDSIKGSAIDLDDGVYKLGKGYVDIRDGKIFDVREIISSFIEE